MWCIMNSGASTSPYIGVQGRFGRDLNRKPCWKRLRVVSGEVGKRRQPRDGAHRSADQGGRPTASRGGSVPVSSGCLPSKSRTLVRRFWGIVRIVDMTLFFIGLIFHIYYSPFLNLGPVPLFNLQNTLGPYTCGTLLIYKTYMHK